MITKKCPYDDTVDESMQRSFEKAVAIFLDGQRKEGESKKAVKRIIKRPNISIKKGLFVLAMISAFLFLFFIVQGAFIRPLETRLYITSIVGLAVIFVNLRKIIIWSVLVYQKLAPEELRLACRFEPSCSEYMLGAIEKYGVLRGMGKGIKRLFRCRHPNGGEDNP